MFKIIVFLVRKPGLTLAEMRTHYETRHLPLARRTFPQIIEHRRNYAQDGGIFFPPGVAAPQWDVISEIWFANRAGFDAMMAFVADAQASGELGRDEAQFLDREKCGMMIVDEVGSS
jgi:hypothetical protein